MNSLIEEILGPLQYNIHGEDACQDKPYNDDLLQSMALDVDHMNLMLSNHGMFDDMMLDDKFYPDTATTTTTINDTTLQQVLIDGLTMLPPPSSSSSTFEESLTYITGDGGETETEATSLGYHSSPSLSSSDLMELPSSVLPPSSQENDTWASFFHHEDDDDNDNSDEAAVVLQQQEQHMSLPGPTVPSFTTTSHPEMLIRNRGEEYTVIIMSGRVAQKSYGTEKRYLSPPPTILVFGGHHHQHPYPPPPSTASCRITTADEAGPVRHETFYPDQDRCLKCVSKQLHIAERRKQIKVSVDIPNFGTFVSKPIKVISKPSKKKQNSAKHPELYVQHGSTIALFNRIHSQTVSTRYLGVNLEKSTSELAFNARPSTWDPFLIWIVDNHVTGGVLRYNQRVVLQCVRTGLLSPVMIIKRKQQQRRSSSTSPFTPIEDNEPVSQLHRITLELVDRPSHYLTCINDTVMTAATATVNDDQAIWTIVGTEFATYSFWKPSSSSSSAAVVASPFPEITHVEKQNDQIIFTGTNLHDDLTFWLGDVQCPIIDTKPGTRTCRLPPTSALLASQSLVVENGDTYKLPILLMRQDNEGIVYGTGRHYTI
ncbi:hypothetical protein O0I10_011892 [Lichtheimia ornata]|uniref:Uncharacterized protein n=1 Tax=Lichtheimia ornata TaxID=688661 RepID=A0AAD7US06_9FUNG|nr:uncharacterized protein O0I10_011892 [Lichtheimia ornata]KAJ8652494.1 hypothetical protein O0I10_011892 [Lichtheimia ornata]